MRNQSVNKTHSRGFENTEFIFLMNLDPRLQLSDMPWGGSRFLWDSSWKYLRKIKTTEVQLAGMEHISSSSAQRQRQVDHLEASLVYVASPKPATTMYKILS